MSVPAALVGMLALLTVVSTLMLVYPIGSIAEYMEFVPLDVNGTQTGKMMNWFRVWLLALPIIHLAGAAAVEVLFFLSLWLIIYYVNCPVQFNCVSQNFVAETRWLKVVLHWISRKKSKKNRYKKVDHITSLATYWPSAPGVPYKSHVDIPLPPKETFL